MKKYKWLVPTLYIIFLMLPIYWLINMSFKTTTEIINTYSLWPQKFTTENYVKIFTDSTWYMGYINSITYTVFNTIISVAAALPAAYAFSRFRGFKGARYSILAAEMMPPAILILPLFLLLYKLELIDSRVGVITAHLTFVIPVVTWFLIGFFDEVPKDLEDQAMIDGYTRFQAFYKVILPVVRPGLGAAGVFGFVLSWNDLFYSLLLTGAESRTLPVAIAGFWTFRGIELGKMAVAILIAVIPVLILSYSIQKHLIRGIGGSGVKY